MSKSQLRYREAKYFLEQFIQHSSPDSYPHMVAYLDAFLLCFVFIEELINKKKKKKLNKQPIFKFLKAARNITAHRFIIASYSEEHPFQVNYVRSVNVSAISGGGFASAQFNISIEKFRQRFEKTLKSDKNKFKLTLNYLKDLENRPETLGKLDITKIAQEGLDTVANLLWPT